MFAQRLIETGIKDLPYLTANRIKLTNLIGLCACVASALYTLTYVTFIVHPVIAGINLLFTLGYFATVIWNHYKAFKISRVWIFCVLMAHLFVCTNLYMDNRSGFHLYYYLVPVGSFLLFDSKEKIEKYLLSAVAVLLYLYCQNTFNLNPMLVISEEANQIIFQSVMLGSMLILVSVMVTFNRYIETNEDYLKYQAFTDPLTGVANRNAFYEKSSEVFEQHQNGQVPFSLVIMDLDHFKSINDNYGHLTGDLCLTEVCRVIKQHCRSQDLFARVGGEEFALVLPNTRLEDAKRIAERMRIAIEEHVILLDDASTIQCTASFGLSTKSSAGDTLRSIIKRADAALYKAKKLGRNCICYDNSHGLQTA